MAVAHVTKENFDSEVLQSDKPVFIDFWASWCGPCQMVAPVVEELSEEIADVKFAKVNVDEQPELARQFQVMSIPTMVLLKEGKVVDTTIGAQPKEDIAKFVHS
ncbi:MAG: thioredoxin [Lachnospiraceae bacterium]|jgi:thioredoxin|nr:thioredoxin [Lachnospiraceae bacterium]RKI30214.1 thioredoxin [bacterium D16-36]RKI65928.1 thioredoxin [bacterium 1xD8-6]